MRHILLSFSLAIAFCSCQKRDEVKRPDDFQVFPDKVTVRAGDTVHFKFQGNPDQLVFWSGRPGSKYEYRTRTVSEGNSLQLRFSSFSQYSDGTGTLTLFASNNFSGIYDTTNIRNATWQDITSRATISSGADNVPSGTINLNDVAAANKPVVVAFRYKTSVLSPTQNRWVIRSFNLDNIAADGSVSALATMANAGWQAFSFKNPATNWSISTAQLLTVRSFTDLDEDWILTRMYDPNKVDPDKGQVVKNITVALSDFAASYPTPGTYHVVFAATNSSYVNQETVLREFDIIVTP